MNAREELKRWMAQCPLVAIIRGVTADQVVAIGTAIYDEGVRIIEVPLNSPDPMTSIARLSAALGDRVLVGAGTVLEPERVDEVREAGGRLIVSPNTHAPVIEATAAAGMISLPGYFTPSEAFDAVRAGAHGLKLFPAEGATPAVVKGQRAVLPKGLPLLVVGGISPDNMQPWLAAGADGFGLGSGLYKAGQSAEETAAKARAYVAGVRR
jgi:2-dehydro-3-deoxyphosphogalactonate aldolase